MKLQVTEVNVFPIENSTTSLLGFCQITISGVLRLTGIKIFDSDKGAYVSYQKNPKSKQNLCFVFPIDKQLREDISNAILDEYDRVMETK